MFGQTSTTSAFASPAGTTGGSTPFGQPANTGFGSTAPFGASTPGATTTSGFGGFSSSTTSTPAFGSATQQQNQSTGFGFGASTAPAFGSTATTTASASPFGAPAPATATGGLFGSTTTNTASNTGGLFGSATTNTTAFGASTATNTTGGFGFTASAPAPTTGGLFGAPAPATGGLFGAPAPAPATGGLFGSTNTSAFGSSTVAAPTTTGFGGFGQQQQQNTGTASIPYQETTHADGSDSISLAAITAMPAYQDKSFDELRLEDYKLGNKGSQGAGQASTGFGGFGSNASAPTPASGGFGLFGSPQPAASNTTSVFGAPAPATGGLFGAPAPATGGLFGSPATQQPATTNLFGASAAPKPALFGAPAPASGLFGAPAAAPATGGLFGAPAPAPATGGLFGSAPAPATGGLFGAPAPATGGLFGSAPAPATGGLFGSAPAPAPTTSLFGASAPAPATGGLFGAAAPAPATGGLFGAAAPVPAPTTGAFSFGAAPAPASGGGLFGAKSPAPATGGLFGAPVSAPSTSLFGAPASTPAPGGLFGVAAPAPAVTAAAPPYVAAPPPSSDVLLAQRLAAVEAQQKELELLEPWRGNSPKNPNVIPSSLSERDAAAFSGSSPITDVGRFISSYASSSAALNSFQSPRSITRIRPRGFGSTKSHISRIDPSRLRSARGSPSLLSPDNFISSSAKRLVINPGSLVKNKKKLLLTNGENNENGSSEKAKEKLDTLGDIQLLASAEEKKSAEGMFVGGFDSPTPHKLTGIDSNKKDENEKNDAYSLSTKSISQKNGYSYDHYQKIVGSPSNKVTGEDGESVRSPASNHNNAVSCIPKLTKNGYSITPSKEEMMMMSEADLATVLNFCVSRDGYGSVLWDGAVDVRNVDLNSVVRIREREVIVYEDEEENGTKPPVGSKLNRSALVTLLKIFPKGGKEATIEAKEKFIKKIEKQTAKMGAKFVSYDPIAGEWKFRTEHFSRYGFDDDSDSDEDEDEKNQNETTPNQISNESYLLTPGDGVLTSTQLDRGRFGVVTDYQSESSRMVSDNEDFGEINEKNILDAADNAYRSFMHMETSRFDNYPSSDQLYVKNVNDIDEMNKIKGDEIYCARKEYPSLYVISKPRRPDFEQISGKIDGGLCSRIAKEYGVKPITSIATDLSLRLRRSFRIGWRPDGSFIFPSSKRINEKKSLTNCVLVQKRPAFQHPQQKIDFLPMLRTHLKFSTNLKTVNGQCPLFELPRGLGTTGGSIETYNQLCLATDEYVKAAAEQHAHTLDNEKNDIEICMIASRAMSLINSLYGQEKDVLTSIDDKEISHIPIDDNVKIKSGESAIVSNVRKEQYLSTASDRRYQGLLAWFREVSKTDMDEHIFAALKHSDPLTAILTALVGGSIEKACDLATQHGFLRLSLIIANGYQSNRHLNVQRQMWHENGSYSLISLNHTRIHAILSGDLGIEEGLYAKGDKIDKLCFNWRLRLGMKLWCSNPTLLKDITQIIDEYDDDVSTGLAPPPEPRYRSNENALDETCILYRLLRLRASCGGKDGDANSSLCLALSPLGYTAFTHDYSLSFHLGAILQGLGVCPNLSDEEQGRLTENYAIMLVDAGLWEWALYVMLCLSPHQTENMTPNKRQNHFENKAKNFFLQHYVCNPKVGDKHSDSKTRSFLQKEVGIPVSWFDQALAMRCAYNGDAMGYVAHLIASQQMEQASVAIQRFILPPSLISGEESLAKLKDFLQSCKSEGVDKAIHWDDNNGCGAILDLLTLSDEVSKLIAMSEDHLQCEANALIEIVQKANDLQGRIIDYDVDQHTQTGFLYVENYQFSSLTDEEYAISFAVAASKLNTLQMKARLLYSKISHLNEHDGEDKNGFPMGSNLAFIAYSQNEGFTAIASEGLFSHSNLRGVTGGYTATR